MSEIDELSVAFVDDGLEVVKELDKVILSRGAWTTILFLYQDWDNKTEDYGKVKATLRRYRKVKGQYRQQSKFNISSMKQGRELAEHLARWGAEHE